LPPHKNEKKFLFEVLDLQIVLFLELMKLLIEVQILASELVLLSDQRNIEFVIFISVLLSIAGTITRLFLDHHFLQILVQITNIRHEVLLILFLMLCLYHMFVIFREILKPINQLLNWIDHIFSQTSKLVDLVHKMVEFLAGYYIRIVFVYIFYLTQIIWIRFDKVAELNDNLVIIFQNIVNMFNSGHQLLFQTFVSLHVHLDQLNSTNIYHIEIIFLNTKTI